MNSLLLSFSLSLLALIHSAYAVLQLFLLVVCVGIQLNVQLAVICVLVRTNAEMMSDVVQWAYVETEEDRAEDRPLWDPKLDFNS